MRFMEKNNDTTRSIRSLLTAAGALAVALLTPGCGGGGSSVADVPYPSQEEIDQIANELGGTSSDSDSGQMVSRQADTSVYNQDLDSATDGSTLIAWVDNSNGDYRTWARIRQADGTLGSIAALGEARSATVIPWTVLSPAGRVGLVVWQSGVSELAYAENRDGRFTPTQTLEDVMSSPRPAFLESRRPGVLALGAWMRSTTSGYVLEVAEFRPDAGWQALPPVPTQLPGETGTTAMGKLAVAEDSAGRIYLAWRQYGSLRVTLYEPGSGWSAVPQELRDQSTGDPFLAVNPSGDALLAWSESQSGHMKIMASRGNQGTWGTAVMVRDYQGTILDSLAVAMTDAGEGLLVWNELRTEGFMLTGNLYWARQDGSTWSTPQSLPDGAASNLPTLGWEAQPDGLVLAWKKGSLKIARYRDGGWTTKNTGTGIWMAKPMAVSSNGSRISVLWQDFRGYLASLYAGDWSL